MLPIPANALVEGGIHASPNGKDHHMLLVDNYTCDLWEVYSAFGTSPWNTNGAICHWSLASDNLRPDTWTSADAAGLPVMPLLIRQDEAANGPIHYAFRLTLDVSEIQGPCTTYQWPARHNTGCGSTSKPMMGQAFRLKANFSIPSSWSTQGKAIATAFQEYGIYLADIGSNGYVQGEPSASWDSNLFCSSKDVQTLTLSDFEAVDMSAVTNLPGFNINSMARPACNPPTSPTLAHTPTPPTAGPKGSTSSGTEKLGASMLFALLPAFLY